MAIDSFRWGTYSHAEEQHRTFLSSLHHADLQGIYCDMQDGVIRLGRRIASQVPPHVLILGGGYGVGKSQLGYALEKGAQRAGIQATCYGDDESADMLIDFLDNAPIEAICPEDRLIIIARSKAYEMMQRKKYPVPAEQATVVSVVADPQTRYENAVVRQGLLQQSRRKQMENRDVRSVQMQPNIVSSHNFLLIDASADRRISQDSASELFSDVLQESRSIQQPVPDQHP